MLKVLCRSWEQRYSNHANHFFNNLVWYAKKVHIQRTNVVKNMVMFSKLRREQMFYYWRTLAQAPLPQPKVKAFEITEEKKTALKRIVLRQYMKLLKKILRKKVVFKIVAGRLALHSRITEQKALWRMVAYFQQLR